MFIANIYGLLLIICIIKEIFCFDYEYKREFKTFRCTKSGKYLRKRDFCDKIQDCSDKSDELYGCSLFCGNGNFKCAENGPCLDIEVRCNTIEDCADGSDEINCGDETEIENCSQNKGKFLCDDKLKCINFDSICDGYCNCLDCSDEINGCLKYDDYLCNKCSRACFKHSEGDTFFSKSINFSPHKCVECDFADKCEQKCIRITLSESRDHCICDENYTSQMENTGSYYGYSKCKNNGPHENILLYATPNEIIEFNLTTNESFIIKNNVDCTALSAAHDNIYYAILVNGTANIFKTSVRSINETYKLIETDSLITSISIDWITGNIYFTTETSLSVCKNGGEICMKLRSCRSCLVALAPRFGWMFWWNDGTHTIMRSTMDGSQDEIVLYSDNFRSTSLVADESTEKVYWLELERREVRFVKFDNPERQRKSERMVTLLYQHHTGLHFTVFEHTVFFALNNGNTIYSRKKSESIDPLFISNNGIKIRHLHFYNPLLQHTKITNPCSISCTGLCLLKPAKYSKLSNSCFCNNTTLQGNNHWCDTVDFPTEITTEPRWGQQRAVNEIDMFYAHKTPKKSDVKQNKINDWPQPSSINGSNSGALSVTSPHEMPSIHQETESETDLYTTAQASYRNTTSMIPFSMEPTIMFLLVMIYLTIITIILFIGVCYLVKIWNSLKNRATDDEVYEMDNSHYYGYVR